MSEAITGTPRERASATGSPKPSTLDGATTAVAPRTSDAKPASLKPDASTKNGASPRDRSRTSMTFSFSQPRWPTRTSLGVVGPKVSIRRRHTAKRKSMFFRGSIVLTFTKYGAVACGGWSLLLSKNHSVTPNGITSIGAPQFCVHPDMRQPIARCSPS